VIVELRRELKREREAHFKEIDQAKQQNELTLIDWEESCFSCLPLVKRLRIEIAKLKDTVERKHAHLKKQFGIH